MKSTISVIIPTYNRAEYLLQALQSVHDQTVKPLEILVVDDGSTDNTRKVILESALSLKYIFQKNSGPAAARNTGINAATGDVIAFLDDDDLLLPNALELCVKQLERKTTFNVDVVLGVVRRVDHVQRIKGEFTYKTVLENWSDRILCCGVFYKKVFDKVGLFDETFLLQSDAEWFMRAREKNIKFSLFDQTTHLHRMHKTNITKNKQVAKLFLLKAIKKSLSRREKVGGGTVLPLAQLSDFIY